jgi:hypothetical protein
MPLPSSGAFQGLKRIRTTMRMNIKCVGVKRAFMTLPSRVPYSTARLALAIGRESRRDVKNAGCSGNVVENKRFTTEAQRPQSQYAPVPLRDLCASVVKLFWLRLRPAALLVECGARPWRENPK